jgi:oxygen-independent coproporphyrinogen-3 oxidase
MYQMMLDRSREEGYVHYEISNLCQPGFESRHNSKYWTGAAVFGFGCSAHSYDGLRRRWANERDALRYTELIESAGHAVVETTELDEHDVRAESVFLGLRLMRGIDLREYRERFGMDLREQHASDLDRLQDAGLIEFDNELMKLTQHGVLLSNEVFSVFV